MTRLEARYGDDAAGLDAETVARWLGADLNAVNTDEDGHLGWFYYRGLAEKGDQECANAAYTALANPLTITRLLAALRASDEDRERLKKENAGLWEAVKGLTGNVQVEERPDGKFLWVRHRCFRLR